MKGIVLAGGVGSRLHPVTKAISKQLIPVYDKPLIYYPLSLLMLSGIREVLIITTRQNRNGFIRLLEDGRSLGMQFSYAVQSQPCGIAEAFLIGKDFIGQDSVALVLGDNIFYGHRLPECLRRVASQVSEATIFVYQVRDPHRYGVVEFNAHGDVVGIEEKPSNPRSCYAVTGLYFYDNRVVDIASNLKPSARGEREITDVNRAYLELRALKVEKLGRGIAWLDAGTSESLLRASHFIYTIQERQGLIVACLEEIAYKMGYISWEEARRLAKGMQQSLYGQYLLQTLEQETQVSISGETLVPGAGLGSDSRSWDL